MDPLDAGDAQQIVIAYARLLERDVTEDRLPARLDSLPYSKPIIKSAIQTFVRGLSAQGQLTAEHRDYLETAYSFLAEYVDNELVELVTQYRQSAEQLASESPLVRDKTQTPAWRTLVESGSLAGEMARATTLETETLRDEFRSFASPAIVSSGAERSSQ